VTGPTAEQPQVTATVSPAVPPRSRWGAIPRHLGRARTSTIVLSVLFLGIGGLWLNVRPDAEAPPADPAVVEQSVVPVVPIPTEPAPTTEPVPTTEPAPTTASEVPTTAPSTDVPTSTETSTQFPTTTSEPTVPAPETATTPTG
jgi:cytoskeletal protein RodZ